MGTNCVVSLYNPGAASSRAMADRLVPLALHNYFCRTIRLVMFSSALILMLFSAKAPAGRRQTGRGQGRPHKGLGHQQAEGVGGAEPAPQGPERPRQRPDEPAQAEAGAAAGHGERKCFVFWFRKQGKAEHR